MCDAVYKWHYSVAGDLRAHDGVAPDLTEIPAQRAKQSRAVWDVGVRQSQFKRQRVHDSCILVVGHADSTEVTAQRARFHVHLSVLFVDKVNAVFLPAVRRLRHQIALVQRHVLLEARLLALRAPKLESREQVYLEDETPFDLVLVPEQDLNPCSGLRYGKSGGQQ